MKNGFIERQSHRVFGLFLIFSILFLPILKISADEFVEIEDVSISAIVGFIEVDEEGDGGGGGGGFSSVPASITFSGIAYPNSPVFVLKNGQEFVQTLANQNALFSVYIPSFPQGTYTFSVVTEDVNSKRSTLFTFPLSIVENVATTISGIFLSPTISVSGQVIKKGNSMIISGQGAPNATISISLKSTLQDFFSVDTNQTGLYYYTLDTGFFPLGLYQTKSKSIKEESESPFSSLISFSIGNTDEVDGVCGSIRADINCDGRINLIDFSILAFWYKKNNPPEKVDLNMDGRVDIRDFSILAYEWTG